MIARGRSRRTSIRWYMIGAIALSLSAVAALLGFIGRSLRPPSAPHFVDENCRETYLRTFRGEDFEIRIVFGYKDARPARFVADRYERMLLVERILAECSPAGGACGFVRDMQDIDLFTKVIHGPDGRPRTVRLRIAQGSAGADDEENRKDPFQVWRSAYAEEVFLNGLRDADIVLYNGHSRAGGGPDFAPPRLRGDAVDYGWYRAKAPGLGAVLRVLGEVRGGGMGLKMLGFLSCASTTHFLGKVESTRPGLATLTSPRLLYFSDALESGWATIDSILSFRCEPGFSDALKKKETRAGGARVSGWFVKKGR